MTNINNLHDITGIIKLGIVAASGELRNERIVRHSLGELSSTDQNFIISDFIDREILFSQADHLLPDNVLTLSIEVEFQTRLKVLTNLFNFSSRYANHSS